MNRMLTLMPVFAMWIVAQSLALRNEMQPTFKNLYNQRSESQAFYTGTEGK